MAYHFGDRLIETSSGTPSGTTTTSISLSGTSPTMTFQGGGTSAGVKFVDSVGIATGDVVPGLHIFQTNDPSKWVDVDGTFTTGSPNTITYTTATVRRCGGTGSSGAGTNPTWSAAVTVTQEQVGLQAQLAFLQAQGHISGIALFFASTTAVTIKAGTLLVNGTIVTIADTTRTSVSSMVDIAASAVTLAASSSYNTYINASGTIAMQKYTGAGDGDHPTYDSTLDYWKAPSTGAAWRYIGKFWTDVSGNVLDFRYTVKGRQRVYKCVNSTAYNVLKNAGVDTTFQPVTMTPFYAPGDTLWLRFLGVKSTSTAAIANDISLDGTNLHMRSQVGNQANGNSFETGHFAVEGYAGALYYKVQSNSSGSITAAGYENRV